MKAAVPARLLIKGGRGGGEERNVQHLPLIISPLSPTAPARPVRRRDVQARVFELIGLSPEEAQAKFGWVHLLLF
jgi:hypothetical protein